MPIKRKSKASLFTPPVLITLGIVIVILLSAVIVVQGNQYLRTATYDDPSPPSASVGGPWDQAKEALYPEPGLSIMDALFPAGPLIALSGGSSIEILSPLAETIILPIAGCLTSWNYISDDDLNKIVNSCISEHPNQPFAQISCAAAAVAEHFEENDYIIDPVCKEYAAVMNRIVGKVDFADAEVKVGLIAFAASHVGHVVNRIEICPTTGPHAGECFEYAYDVRWSPGVFYPLTPSTINYHSSHATRLWFPKMYELASDVPPPLPPDIILDPSPDEPDEPDEPDTPDTPDTMELEL